MKSVNLSAACIVGVLAAGNAEAISVSPSSSATDLVNAILGTGVSLVGTPSLTAAANQVGTFSGGAGEVGFGSGIVLSTGNVNDIPGPNDVSGVLETRSGGDGVPDVNTTLGTGGVAEIANSFDAAVLEFDFQFGDGTVGGELNFAYTFASEEYIDFIDTGFNDEFQLLVNGVNLAVIGTDEVNINNVNDVNNSAFYINNVPNGSGLPDAGLDFSFDGLTTVLVASSGPLGSGVHTARFVIADVADEQFDAGVFIQAGSFDAGDPNGPSEVPLPAGLPLLLGGLASLGLLSRVRRAA